MTNGTPEIRFDHMTDRALLDDESTHALRTLSARWAASAVHATTQRARRRQDALQRGWMALASLRADHDPFPLIRRSSGVTRYAITPQACITIH